MKIVTKLGAHMSTEAGAENALYRGALIGCNVIQIFIKGNRRWEFTSYNESEIEKFNQGKIKTGIKEVIAHSRYLINLASLNEEIQNKSINTLEKELINCDKLGINYLVLHPGSGPDSKLAIEKITNSINSIFDKNNSNAIIALENTAGQGNYIGSNFEELANLINKIKNKNRIGICLDTCHAWAAGYDFSTLETYNEFWQMFNSTIGLEYLKVMHINNSKNKQGSHVDRHEDIDKGQINIEAFKLIMNDKKLFNIPKIIETPYETDKDLEKNLILLKNLIKN